MVWESETVKVGMARSTFLVQKDGAKNHRKSLHFLQFYAKTKSPSFIIHHSSFTDPPFAPALFQIFQSISNFTLLLIHYINTLKIIPQNPKKTHQ